MEDKGDSRGDQEPMGDPESERHPTHQDAADSHTERGNANGPIRGQLRAHARREGSTHPSSAFRPKLAEGAFITPLDHCLAILPAEEFDRMADRLESQVAAGGVDVNALRHFASQADEVTPDSQGRVRLFRICGNSAGSTAT